MLSIFVYTIRINLEIHHTALYGLIKIHFMQRKMENSQIDPKSMYDKF